MNTRTNTEMSTISDIMARYSTTQTSGNSTIDCYWQIVNNRYRDISNKVSFAYDIPWIDGCLSDIAYGVGMCDIVLRSVKNEQARGLIKNYASSFKFIASKLELIKQELSN
mgnify:FL=1